MFEQAILSPGHETKRVWTTAMGVTTQALVVTGMILAPMIWPEVLPKGQLFVPLVGPRLESAPRVGQVAVRPQESQSAGRIRLPWTPQPFQAPSSVPTSIAMIDEPIDVGGVGLRKGLSGVIGSPDGMVGGIPFSPGVIPGPPPRPVDAAPVAPIAAPVSKPILVGGDVAAAMLRHRVDPPYPPLARQMRVQGVVELRGIIGIDGRIRELKVLAGHPLLAKAALDAISQWVYQPTRLNGQAVEVDAPITVTFRLN